MDGMIFKLNDFEGPMDLLLRLIETHKIDIYNIPIAELTDSYLEYLELLKQEDMEGLSEFIVMAATLIEIKSRILLPVQEDEEEGDPREELVRRIIEYKQFKEAAEELNDRQRQRLYPVFKEADAEIKREILKDNENREISDILNGADGDMLFNAFKEVMRRREVRVDRVRSGFDHVVKDLFTVEDKVKHIKNVIALKKRIEFEELFDADCTRSEIITTFLALLELIKGKLVNAVQEKIFGKIYIEEKETENLEENAAAEDNNAGEETAAEVDVFPEEAVVEDDSFDEEAATEDGIDEEEVSPEHNIIEEDAAAEVDVIDEEAIVEDSLVHIEEKAEKVGKKEIYNACCGISMGLRGIDTVSCYFKGSFEEEEKIEFKRKGSCGRSYIICGRRGSGNRVYRTSHRGGCGNRKGAYREPCHKIQR